ncbi:MAG: sulfatase [Planctomycetota bacterium]
MRLFVPGLLLLVITRCVGLPAAEKPNILFIMSDDHAAHAIGAYGGRLAELDPTPNIDRLAREGVRLTNCFCTNSICVPSRATILTGQYSHVNGIKTLSYSLEPARQSLPLEMKQAGYETAIIGKWHLGAEPATFDHYCVLPGQGLYFNPVFRVRGPNPWPENAFRPQRYDSIHSSDAITDLSLKWLKQRERKDKPFFLMHHFKAPHDNFENAERYDWLYQDEIIPEPPSLTNRGNHGPLDRAQYGTSVSKRNERRNMGHHMFVSQDLEADEYTSIAYQRYLKKFLRAVRGVDDNIGRLMEHLESTGELERTIIIYTADQGFMLGEHDYIDKRWMYEESLRMPWIIRYPKQFSAGTVVDDMINNVDFAPTLLELAGEQKPVEKWQGRSFVSNLEGHTSPEWPTATYYRYWMHMTHHDNPAHYGIRTKDHKLIYFYGLPLDAVGALSEPTPAHWELYDLQDDPHEMNNVYADPSYAPIVKKLKAQLSALKQEVGDSDANYPELSAVAGSLEPVDAGGQ